jgi:FkbM family methyltransferase
MLTDSSVQTRVRDVHVDQTYPTRLRLLRWLGRQNWIPRGKDRLVRLFCDPNKCEPYTFEVGFFGHKYRGDISQYIDWVVFAYGSYAYYELSLLEEIASEMKKRRGVVSFYDIGANVGNHTLFMAAHVDRVFAFEPFAAVRERVEEKIAINQLDNVTLFPVALGAVDEELSYFPVAGRNPGAGTLNQNHGEGFAAPITVPVMNGDQFIDAHKLPKVDLIKIDVEGFEPFALRGLSHHILEDRPIILTELSDGTRRNIGSERAFRELFYDDALFVGVSGRQGARFTLCPFQYVKAQEVLVAPSEWKSFIEERL